MLVAGLELQNFRSYADVRVPLTGGTTVFLGSNGQGKTNLVEALQVLSTLSSHRVASDHPLVRTGHEQALVRAVVRRAGREVTVDLEITPGRANRARLNGGTTTRARSILGILRTVMFSPEDLALVRGDPGGRRRFVDELLTSLTPRLGGLRADFERVLKQRTALLRSARAARNRVDRAVLEVWDAQLASLGGELMAHRLSLLEQLQPQVTEAYGTLSGAQEECQMTYVAGDELVPTTVVGESPAERVVRCIARLRDEVERRRSDELERGLTLVGPQRHDVELSLAGLAAKSHASHGESWSLALALKLGALSLLRVDDDPVLILDDVFAELDASRRRRLATAVAGVEQVLVTAAVASDVPDQLEGVSFTVAHGTVSRS